MHLWNVAVTTVTQLNQRDVIDKFQRCFVQPALELGHNKIPHKIKDVDNL